MDGNKSVPKRARSRSPSIGLPRKSTRTDPGISYPSFRDIHASESSSRRSWTSSFVPQDDTRSGAKSPQHTSDDNISLDRSLSNGADATTLHAPAIDELTRELVTLLLKTCDASTRHDLAVQRAATARRDYDNAQRHFDMYPPMAEQRQNRRAQTEKDVKQTDAVLQPLRSSLLNTFETLFNSMSSRDHQRASADHSCSLNPRKRLEPVLTELDKTRRAADEANSRNNRLEQKLKSLQPSLERLESVLSELDKTRLVADQATRKNHQLEQRLNSLQPSLERLERLECVLSELDKTKAVADQITHRNNQLEQQLNSLQQASSNLVPREKLEALRSELTEARKVAGQATHKNDQLERRLDSLQQAFNANTQQLKRNTNEVETTQKSIRSLEPSIEQDRARIETLKRQVEAQRVEYEKRLAAMDLVTRRHQVSIEKANTSIGCLKEESSRHKKTGSEASMDIQQLQIRLTDNGENVTSKHDTTKGVAPLPTAELGSDVGQKLEAPFGLRLKQELLQVLEDDAKSKEEIVFDHLAEFEVKLDNQQKSMETQQGMLNDLQAKLPGGQPDIEVEQLNERLDVLTHIVNDFREKLSGDQPGVAVGQLAERLNGLSYIVNNLREKLPGTQPGVAFGQLTERLDALAHCVNDLESRFNRMQTDDMIRAMVQHVIPQMKKAYPVPIQIQKSIDDLYRSHNTMGLQIENKTNSIVAVMDGKLIHVGGTVQALQAKVAGLANQEEQIKKLEGDIAKLDKSVSALSMKATPGQTNEYTALGERIETLQKKVERLSEFNVDHHDAIAHVQVEMDELAMKVGISESDLPDWEGTGGDL